VDGGTHRHLYRLEVQLAALAPVLENPLELLCQLAGRFFAGGRCRFFSCDTGVWSEDRAWQILVLTAMNSRMSCSKRRNSAISRSALCCAAGVGSDSVTVFPCCLKVKRGFGPCAGLPGLWHRQLGFPTTTAGIGNGTTAQVAQSGELREETGSSGLQIWERIGHKAPPYPSVYYTHG
jgi:hypothetical protein